MRLLFVFSALVVSLSFSFGAHAETATYGSIVLQGDARDSGSMKPPGLADVMVCNVNGTDKFLSVRTGPGSQYGTLRKIERLAILTVDSTSRDGNWVYVTAGHRTHTVDGFELPQITDLHVQGWVHDAYLCDYYIP